MLDKAQLEALRSVLVARGGELRSLIDEERQADEIERAQASTSEVGDYGDERVGADLTRTGRALLRMHRDELQEVEEAMARMSEDRYGICVDCQDEIGLERLRASPTCRRCGPCQRRFETATGSARALR